MHVRIAKWLFEQFKEGLNCKEKEGGCQVLNASLKSGWRLFDETCGGSRPAQLASLAVILDVRNSDLRKIIVGGRVNNYIFR